jgi:GntP family gluconate:H+ symporter
MATQLFALGGERHSHWTLAFVGFVIGLPVFFSVGLVLLVPLVMPLARRRLAPGFYFTLPLVTGLSVAHGLIPPHPGPLAAVTVLKADIGKTMLYALGIGLPTLVLCGPLLATWLAKRVRIRPGATSGEAPRQQAPEVREGSFGLALFTLLLPILLMLAAALADLLLSTRNPWRRGADLAGNPLVAMVAGVLFAYCSFGLARGYSAAHIGKLAEESLAPVASILLVVGAGGGFSRVLTHCGVGNSLAVWANSLGVSPLLLGWLVAGLLRIATGSATVAITTAAGLLAPLAAADARLNRELLVVSLGAGSLILSHVNDSGFWLVKEYLDLSVVHTLQTWTVIETAISVVGLVGVLLLSLVF